MVSLVERSFAEGVRSKAKASRPLRPHEWTPTGKAVGIVLLGDRKMSDELKVESTLVVVI